MADLLMTNCAARMTAVNLIAAVGRHGQIGLKGSLPWRRTENRADIALFWSTVAGDVMVVGRRTFEMLPTNAHSRAQEQGVVLAIWDRQEPAEFLESVRIYHPGRPIWICGGAATYAAFAPRVDGVRILSAIAYDGPADAFFPFEAYGIEWRPNT